MQLGEPCDERVDPGPPAGADREDLVDALELGGVGEHRGGPGPAQSVDLVDRADHRHFLVGGEQGARDEAVAGADPLLRR